MKKILDISIRAARAGLVFLLLVAITTAGASSAERVCQPVLEEPIEQLDAGVALQPDPLSEETDSENMAGTSKPYSEQDAAQLSRWIAPTVDKPQGRRAGQVAVLEDSAVDSSSRHRGPPIIGSLAEAVPGLNHQATLVGARPSGTM